MPRSNDANLNLADVLDRCDAEALAVLLKGLEKTVKYPVITASDLELITNEAGRLHLARKVGKAELVRDIRTALNNKQTQDEEKGE